MRIPDRGFKHFAEDLYRFMISMGYLGFVGLLFFLLFMMLAVFRISCYTFKTYTSCQDIPFHKVGLLLGTSSQVTSGRVNQYFTYRILAAAELYHAGKIEYVLVSGDNRHESYNEPRMMYRALIKNGIPAERIAMDFAGISTLDSVIRASRVFMLKDLTVISQAFHNERALFIADHYGIDAVGYNAAAPDDGPGTFKISVREVFAKIKCALDIFILHSGPKFLGPPIPIGDQPVPKLISNKPRPPSSKPKLPGRSVAGNRAAAADEALRQIAKQPTDSAAYTRRVAAASPATQQIDADQEQLLEAEHEEALRHATQAAEDSMNVGNATYIDPTVTSGEQAGEETAPVPQAFPPVSETTPSVPESTPAAAPAENTAPPPRAPIRRQPRSGIVIHGDPWDYY